MYEHASLRPGAPPARPSPVPGSPWSLIDASEILGLLRSNIAGIAGAMAACVLAAVAFLLLAQPSYTAATQIIVDPVDLRVVDNSLRVPKEMTDTQIAQVEDEVRVITSVPVLRRVVETQNLASDPEFAGSALSPLSKLTDGWSRLLGHPSATPADPAMSALRTLARQVTAKREERTFVVTITAKADEAVKAAQIADAVVAAFLQVQADNRTAATRRVAGSLGDRLDSLRRSVEEAERRVVEYKAQHDMVAAVGQSVTEQQLVTATARLGDLRTQLVEADSRYAQIQNAQRSGDPGAVPEALQSTTIAGLRTQLTETRRKESDLAATLGPRHPSLNEARAEEHAVRQQVQAEIGRIAAALKSNRDRIKADLAAAQATFKALENRVTTNSQLSVPLSELERAAQADRTVYESTLARTREVAEQERINTANVSIVSPAQVPEAKSWPPRALLVLAGALVLGFLLGCGSALGLELLDRRRLAQGDWGVPTR